MFSGNENTPPLSGQGCEGPASFIDSLCAARRQAAGRLVLALKTHFLGSLWTHEVEGQLETGDQSKPTTNLRLVSAIEDRNAFTWKLLG